MTTITRQKLRDAIEAGIAAAATKATFGAEDAARLRQVGTDATVVARGAFATAFDRATWVASWSAPEYSPVLHITDDNTTEGEA